MIIPQWIADHTKDPKNGLDTETNNHLVKIMDLSEHFEENFIRIPEEVKIHKLEKTDPASISKISQGNENEAVLMYNNIVEQCNFYFLYQVNELSKNLIYSLKEGMFYSSNIIIRSILEISCYYTYFFEKSELEFKKSLNHLRSASHTKSKSERSRQYKNFIKCLIDASSILIESINSSSRNSQKYKDGDLFLENEKRRTHIHDCIRYVQKKSKFKLWESYEILSEFCHPNLGSRTLMISSINPIDSIITEFKIGNSKNASSAIWFLNNISEGLYYSITLSLSLNQRIFKMHTILKDMLDFEG